MKLTARAPLDMVGGRDRRPGDTFDLDDEALGASLVASGKCEADAVVKAKPAAVKGAKA